MIEVLFLNRGRSNGDDKPKQHKHIARLLFASCLLEPQQARLPLSGLVCCHVHVPLLLLLLLLLKQP